MLSAENGAFDQLRSDLERLAKKLDPADIHKLGRYLIWPLQRAEVDAVLSRIERVKSLVQISLQGDHFVLSQAIKNDTQKTHQRIELLLNDTGTLIADTRLIKGQSQALQDGMVDASNGISDLQTVQKEQELQQVAKWLSPLDFKINQSYYVQKRQQGTGEWLLKSAEFETWMQGNRETMWCPGIPSATITDHLEKLYDLDDSIAVLCIYCNHKEHLQHTSLNLIGALLKQLIQNRLIVSNTLSNLYRKHTFHNTHPNLDELIKTTKSEFTSYTKVFVIVDALDECSEKDGTRENLLHNLRALGITNLLVTSRYVAWIGRMFDTTSTRLDIEAHKEDVQKYVEGRIFRENRLIRHIKTDPSLQDLLIGKIVDSTNGMFLIAQLHMDSVASKSNRKAIRNSLETLPMGLDETYQEAMKRIYDQSRDDRELANEVLSWITFALRPLSMSELQNALAIEPEKSELDTDAVPDEEILLSVCAGLVVVDQESGVVRLVRKFFTRENIHLNSINHI
ncbi:MAG: hypothetical protein Q9187_008807 [Circinaria calcarea]